MTPMERRRALLLAAGAGFAAATMTTALRQDLLGLEAYIERAGASFPGVGAAVFAVAVILVSVATIGLHLTNATFAPMRWSRLVSCALYGVVVSSAMDTLRLVGLGRDGFAPYVRTHWVSPGTTLPWLVLGLAIDVTLFTVLTVSHWSEEGGGAHQDGPD